mmetsp:Transcript_20560/g.35336  ORF Transcript_20560/g.35336 Transcript_20560/m.35336 type:complete len:251 (-) Transcript_20560:864-1616(-)
MLPFAMALQRREERMNRRNCMREATCQIQAAQHFYRERDSGAGPTFPERFGSLRWSGRLLHQCRLNKMCRESGEDRFSVTAEAVSNVQVSGHALADDLAEGLEVEIFGKDIVWIRDRCWTFEVGVGNLSNEGHLISLEVALLSPARHIRRRKRPMDFHSVFRPLVFPERPLVQRFLLSCSCRDLLRICFVHRFPDFLRSLFLLIVGNGNDRNSSGCSHNIRGLFHLVAFFFLLFLNALFLLLWLSFGLIR